MLRSLFTLLITAFSLHVFAQFAPQAPLPGHNGIAGNDTLIIGWANGCTVERGWLDITDKSLGYATSGTAASVLGAPDLDVLSLGDSGVAVVTFLYSIRNGEGPDFAVFENGFPNPIDASMAYLEFAFVEVSSDGSNFVRFPATCNIQDTQQIDNFTYMDASLVDNLAGKYITGYGTPFDLEELKDAAGLDVNNITHIRLVDVVGILDPLYASSDKSGRMINDPHPSPYPTCGFDLNAVAVLHDNRPSSVGQLISGTQLTVYPNPATERLSIRSDANIPLHFYLTDISGRKVIDNSFVKSIDVDLKNQAKGMYLLYVSDGKSHLVQKIIRK